MHSTPRDEAPRFPLDAERVAAFLDGQLDGAEREAVLAQLATDPDWREVLVEVRALEALEAGASPPEASASATMTTVPALHTTPNGNERTRGVPDPARRQWPWWGLAAAAAIALVVWRNERGTDDTTQQMASLDAGAAYAMTLPQADLDALQRNRWPVQRAQTDSLSSIGRAVRLGAWAVDLGLNRTKGQEEREAMEALLGPVPGAGAAIALLRIAHDSASHAQAIAAVRAIVMDDAFLAGVGLELLRAGASRDVEAVHGQLVSLRSRGAEPQQIEAASQALKAAAPSNAEAVRRAASRALELVAR